MLDWRGVEYIDEVDEGQVILISHNRGTWRHSADPLKINCVVVFRDGDTFRQFGPDRFTIDQIDKWTYFNRPD